MHLCFGHARPRFYSGIVVQSGVRYRCRHFRTLLRARLFLRGFLMKSYVWPCCGRTFSVGQLMAYIGVAATISAAAACTRASPSGAAVLACVDSLCKPDNKCLSDGKETKCRLTCDSDQSATASCPEGYYCKVGVSPGANYCEVGDLRTSWGRACAAAASDEVCGPLPNFKCFARAPFDAQAFCTIADCTADSDCTAPGYYCATVDEAPNLREAKRSFGKTLRWCLPRTQCAPCAADADCSTAEGEQRCVKDRSGVPSCMKVCAANGECLRDHACNVEQPDGAKVCFPIGGACKGDGTICSRCGSDDDCATKLCLADPLTDERNCAGSAEATKCSFVACRIVNGTPQNTDCESGWCIRDTATTGVCAAGTAIGKADASTDASTAAASDAGEPERSDAGSDFDGGDAGPVAPESCRGANVPKGAFRVCTQATKNAYCVGLKQLPSGGSYPGCFSRETSGR
jgi:hypothetical protein